MKKADNTAGAAAKRGLQSGYGYDLIGNRIMDQQHTPTSGNGLSEAVWTANALNQITERENHDSRWVFGHVKEAATLTVSGNSGEVIREGEEFAIPVSRTGAATDADWHSLDVTATLAGAGRVVNGTPLDVTTQRQGKVWFPTSPEDLQYDDDGNLTQDGRWNFTWNAENRLIRAETRADVAAATGMPQERLDMAYDAMGRRIRKAVYQLETSNLEPETWVLKSDLRFLYEGTSWNLVAEIEMSPSLPVSSSPSLVRSYAWGTDISGTVTGAGGVGGLLLVQQLSTTANNSQPSSTVSAPCYDGNGNVSAYVKVVDGAVSSRHDYDAFGRPVWSELEGTGGRQVAASPFGFSTKYLDGETGLLSYGYRYYSPETGLWLSRDPLDEADGPNLYAMVHNNPVNMVDIDGRTGWGPNPNMPAGFNPITGAPMNPSSGEDTWKGDITLSVKDLVDNAATGTITLGVELFRTGEMRLDYARLASELTAKGLPKADAEAARDALKAAFREKQTALGKALQEEFLRQRQQSGHVTGRNNAGKTNVKLNADAKVMKGAGRALAVVGFAIEVYNVASAPEGERAGEAARAGGRIGGGALGGWGAGALGGAWGGPWGAGIGALVGGIGGSFAGEGAVELVCPEKEKK